MSQFRTGRLAAAVLATAVLVVAFGAAGVARADIISVTLHETGFADMTFSTPSNPASTGTGGTISFGDFMVNVSASSLTSDPTTARLSTTQISVQDTDTGSLAHELTITTKATPYAAPTGDPLALQSSLSESFLSVGAPLDFTSYLNGLLGTASPTLSLTGTGGTAQSATAADTPGPRGGATFELDSVMDVTLSGLHQSVTATGSTAAVPEPSRVIALAGLAGMLGLGLVWQARRTSNG